MDVKSLLAFIPLIVCIYQNRDLFYSFTKGPFDSFSKRYSKAYVVPAKIVANTFI